MMYKARKATCSCEIKMMHKVKMQTVLHLQIINTKLQNRSQDLRTSSTCVLRSTKMLCAGLWPDHTRGALIASQTNSCNKYSLSLQTVRSTDPNVVVMVAFVFLL